jgi:hypothetical protein
MFPSFCERPLLLEQVWQSDDSQSDIRHFLSDTIPVGHLDAIAGSGSAGL